MRQNARPFRRNMGEEGGHGFPVRGVAVGLERVAERVQRHPLPLAFVQQRGQRFRQGEKYGMIKFGSTTELILPRPDDIDVRVAVGDKVTGGRTVLAVVRAE